MGRARRPHELRRRRLLRGGPGGRRYDRAVIAVLYGLVCYLCGQPLAALTLDHVIPLGRGGPDAAWNLRPACAGCNARKADRLLAELDWTPALPPADPRLWVELPLG